MSLQPRAKEAWKILDQFISEFNEIEYASFERVFVSLLSLKFLTLSKLESWAERWYGPLKALTLNDVKKFIKEYDSDTFFGGNLSNLQLYVMADELIKHLLEKEVDGVLLTGIQDLADLKIEEQSFEGGN